VNSARVTSPGIGTAAGAVLGGTVVSVASAGQAPPRPATAIAMKNAFIPKVHFKTGTYELSAGSGEWIAKTGHKS